MFGDEFSLIVAFVIGIGFGFFLERAGFGSARKLAAQFYFTDLSVLKVMFTAIITAMGGLYALSRLGLVDLSLVYLTPTFLAPQIAGGLILGFGFVIGGYCPGTSCVAAATGRIDGMVYLGGMVAGLLGFAEVYPFFAKWLHATPMGTITLPKLTSLPYGVLVFGVILMALGAFLAAEWAEKRFGGKKADPAQSLLGRSLKLNPVRGLALALVLLGLGAAVGGDPYRDSQVTINTRELARLVGQKADHVTAVEVANWIIQGRTDFTLVDLRETKDFNGYHIPSARNIPLSDFRPDAGMSPTEKIVLYSDGGIHAAQAWLLLKARGFQAVYSILGGLDEWKETVLFPQKPAKPTPEEQLAFEKSAQMAKYFGGSARDASGGEAATSPALPQLTPPPVPPAGGNPGGTAKPKKTKEGC
jgi:rhodanese-related sulfurtransferase